MVETFGMVETFERREYVASNGRRYVQWLRRRTGPPWCVLHRVRPADVPAAERARLEPAA